MKNSKKAAIIMALIFTLALPITAFAGITNTPVGNSIRLFCGIDSSKLTDTQKTDMLNSFKKMMEVKKEAVIKMVENKTITKSEGDTIIKSIDDMVKYRVENGFGTANGTGLGMMNGNGKRGNGGGMRNNGGCQYYPSTSNTNN